MSNYDTVEPETLTMIDKIITDRYPILNGCYIQTIIYTKKKVTKGKFDIVKLTKPTPIIKHIFALGNGGNELDYILTIYSEVFGAISDDDKKLSIMHALEYADVDLDKNEPYNLRGAEVETFYDEIDFTNEDALWQQRIQTVAESVYAKDD